MKKNKNTGSTPTSKPADSTPQQDAGAKAAAVIEQQSGTEVNGQAEPQGKVALEVNDEAMFTLYENTIRNVINGFMGVGMGLKAIKDSQLHKVKFKDLTFEDYCRTRWGLSDKHAYRLIDAYTCVARLQKELVSPIGEIRFPTCVDRLQKELVSPIGEIRFPINESQVRPLLALVPEQQVKAWQQVLKACEAKPITAVEVEEVVNKMLGKPSQKNAAQPKAPAKKAEQKLVKIGKLVTKALEKDESKLTVPGLKKILEKIQEMIGAKK